MTEQQNKQQYESFVTSAIYNGSLDMIVGYKEWLETIRSYKPRTYQESKDTFYDIYLILRKDNDN